MKWMWRKKHVQIMGGHFLTFVGLNFSTLFLRTSQTVLLFHSMCLCHFEHFVFLCRCVLCLSARLFMPCVLLLCHCGSFDIVRDLDMIKFTFFSWMALPRFDVYDLSWVAQPWSSSVVNLGHVQFLSYPVSCSLLYILETFPSFCGVLWWKCDVPHVVWRTFEKKTCFGLQRHQSVMMMVVG